MEKNKLNKKFHFFFQFEIFFLRFLGNATKHGRLRREREDMQQIKNKIKNGCNKYYDPIKSKVVLQKQLYRGSIRPVPTFLLLTKALR